MVHTATTKEYKPIHTIIASYISVQPCMLRDHHSNKSNNSISILCIECSITQKYNNEAKTRKEAKTDDNDANGNQSLTTNEEQWRSSIPLVHARIIPKNTSFSI